MRSKRSGFILWTMWVFVVWICGPLLAQADKPVYPSFEGHTPNPDGSFSLVFGYYSGNNVPVEVAVGEANGFGPGPVDRGQTTTFLPGHQRGHCVIVVGPDFQGNLQWTVDFAGQRTTTTESGGLDPIYLLEAANPVQRSIRSIDVEAAPRGICLNRPPTVFMGFRRSSADLEATVGQATQLPAIVVDEGLPQGGELSSLWTVVGDPAGVVFEDSTDPQTKVVFSNPGTYELRLSATDSELSGESTLKVTVE